MGRSSGGQGRGWETDVGDEAVESVQVSVSERLDIQLYSAPSSKNPL